MTKAMKKDIWVCLVHNASGPSVLSSDAYSSLTVAQDALCRRLCEAGVWVDDFNYLADSGVRRYELKCVTIDD